MTDMLSQEELDKLLEGGGEDESAEGQETSETKEQNADEGIISQDDIDSLLSGGQDGGEEASQAQETDVSSTSDDDIDWGDAFAEAAAGGDPAAAKAMSEGVVDEVLNASSDDTTPGSSNENNATTATFNNFSQATSDTGQSANLDFILEIPLEISVELGRSKMQIKELLQLGQGSVVELDKMAGEPADIYVNQKLLAKGEIVVMNEKFGVKLTEIISPADRVKSLG